MLSFRLTLCDEKTNSILSKPFLDFYKVQDEKVKMKIKNVLELIRQVDRIPEKFLKHVAEIDGLFEIRVEYNSNIYRIFCCFDKGNLVILLNAYHKKTQKIPSKVLEKAKKLKFEYFNKTPNNGQI